jgi:hypothetical protein
MLRIVFSVLYLSYLLSAGIQTKQGSGWDPSGLAAPPPHTAADQGSGWDPNG